MRTHTHSSWMSRTEADAASTPGVGRAMMRIPLHAAQILTATKTDTETRSKPLTAHTFKVLPLAPNANS